MEMLLQHGLVLLLGFGTASPAAVPWADRLFDEMSKDFGSVPQGSVLVHRFHLGNNTGEPVHIARVEVSSPCVTAQARKTLLLPGEETTILARMDTTHLRGAKNVTIAVAFDRPSVSEVRLLLSAVGRDDFHLSPDTLAFGQVRQGSPRSVSSTITFHGDNPVRITEVSSETNYVGASLQELSRDKNGTVYRLSAQLRHDTPAGKWFGDICLKTNHKDLPPIRIPVLAEVEPTPGPAEVAVLSPSKPNPEAERPGFVPQPQTLRLTGIEGPDERPQLKQGNLEEKIASVVPVGLMVTDPGHIAYHDECPCYACQVKRCRCRLLARLRCRRQCCCTDPCSCDSHCCRCPLLKRLLARAGCCRRCCCCPQGLEVPLPVPGGVPGGHIPPEPIGMPREGAAPIPPPTRRG